VKHVSLEQENEIEPKHPIILFLQRLLQAYKQKTLGHHSPPPQPHVGIGGGCHLAARPPLATEEWPRGYPWSMGRPRGHPRVWGWPRGVFQNGAVAAVSRGGQWLRVFF